VSIRREHVAVAQGAYYGATGLWALLHRPTFEAVTGDKGDFYWLAEALGLLLLPVGAALARAGATDRVTPEVRLLGQGAAAALGAADVAIAARRLGRPTYLLDAAVSAALVAAWGRGRHADRPRDGPAPPGASPQHGNRPAHARARAR
jgi:hypothetical protein